MLFVWFESSEDCVMISNLDPELSDYDSIQSNHIAIPIPKGMTVNAVKNPILNVLRNGSFENVIDRGDI